MKQFPKTTKCPEKIGGKWALLEAIAVSYSCLSLGGDESPAGDQTQHLLQVTPDLRFQGELRAATGNPRGGSVLFTHLEYPRCHRGGLEGNIQTCSARQRSHQGLPSFWRQRVPAPPSTSNYPCWSRRGKSHLAFGLPKNTVFFSVYLEWFLSSSSF